MSHPLLEQIVAATAGEYALIGELGETGRGTAFLAREAASGQLVVLFVPADAESLEVLAAIGDEVPANAGRCTACGHAPMVWRTHCPNCHRPFVLEAVDAHRFTLDEVQAATAHVYDVEGEVGHLSGGSLFFVRDRVDHRLVALAGQVDADGQQVLEAVWDAADAPPAVIDRDLAPAYPASFDDATAGPASGAIGAAAGDPASTGVVDVADVPGPPGRRRGWVPLAVVAALVAVLGGVWAFQRDDPSSASSRPGTLAVAPAGGGGRGAASPVGPTEGGTPAGGPAGGAAASVSRTTPGEDVSTRPPVPDSADESRRRAADSVRRAERAPAFVQIATEPPAGWNWRIDGRPGPSARTVKLRPRREHVIELEAPGYCPDVLRLTPEPASTQAWTPRLRGKPMIGNC